MLKPDSPDGWSRASPLPGARALLWPCWGHTHSLDSAFRDSLPISPLSPLAWLSHCWLYSRFRAWKLPISQPQDCALAGHGLLSILFFLVSAPRTLLAHRRWWSVCWVNRTQEEQSVLESSSPRCQHRHFYHGRGFRTFCAGTTSGNIVIPDDPF